LDYNSSYKLILLRKATVLPSIYWYYCGYSIYVECTSSVSTQPLTVILATQSNNKLEMWANTQRDGRPAEYRWRPLFNVAKFGW